MIFSEVGVSDMWEVWGGYHASNILFLYMNHGYMNESTLWIFDIPDHYDLDIFL